MELIGRHLSFLGQSRDVASDTFSYLATPSPAMDRLLLSGDGVCKALETKMGTALIPPAFRQTPLRRWIGSTTAESGIKNPIFNNVDGARRTSRQRSAASEVESIRRQTPLLRPAISDQSLRHQIDEEQQKVSEVVIFSGTSLLEQPEFRTPSSPSSARVRPAASELQRLVSLSPSPTTSSGKRAVDDSVGEKDCSSDGGGRVALPDPRVERRLEEKMSRGAIISPS